MVHLWRKAKEETETSKSAPGVGATGDIAVIVDGKKLDNELVRLACLMAVMMTFGASAVTNDHSRGSSPSCAGTCIASSL